MTSEQGFSLIEILVAIAIVAILAGIAIPSYSNYLDRGKLITAQSDVALLSLKFENRYQRILAYPLSDLSDKVAVQNLITDWSPASDESDFSFSSVDATASTYTIRAVGLRGGVENCVVIIDQTGSKSISNCSTFAADGEWL